MFASRNERKAVALGTEQARAVARSQLRQPIPQGPDHAVDDVDLDSGFVPAQPGDAEGPPQERFPAARWSTAPQSADRIAILTGDLRAKVNELAGVRSGKGTYSKSDAKVFVAQPGVFHNPAL